jgi:hypothetical protein
VWDCQFITQELSGSSAKRVEQYELTCPVGVVSDKAVSHAELVAVVVISIWVNVFKGTHAFARMRHSRGAGTAIAMLEYIIFVNSATVD